MQCPSHTVDEKPNENEQLVDVHYLPFGPVSMSPKAFALLETLQSHTQTTDMHVIESALLHYAKAQLTEEQLGDIEESLSSAFLTPQAFYPERQIAIYNDVVDFPSLTRLINAPVHFGILQLQKHPELQTLLVSLCNDISRSFYHQLSGFFPCDLTTIDGFYIEEIRNAAIPGPYTCDAQSDLQRQLSILVVLTTRDIEMVFTSSDEPIRVVLEPGQIIGFPSNYSASYRFEGDGFCRLLKMYRFLPPQEV